MDTPLKVLWFAATSSLYEEGTHFYNGGGWISSLERLITEKTNIDLAISFYHPRDEKKVTKEKTTYYPIKIKRQRQNPLKGIYGNWLGKVSHANLGDKYIEVINDFKPDVIHVFGSESEYARIVELTKIPVIIHLQGIINPYYNAFYPVGQSKWNFYFNPSFLLNNILGKSEPFMHKKYGNIAHNEKKYLSITQNVMGRTWWDGVIASHFNPEVNYFHVDEVLRPIFYENTAIDPLINKSCIKIISTLSPTLYKGVDLVLKASKELKSILKQDFEWSIIGLDENNPRLKHFEKSLHLKHKDLNIKCLGRQNELEIREKMLSSDIYIHPSYIDNSPNSLCEAQILGLPIIACNVGGVASLINHEIDGILIPSNGLYELAHYVRKLALDDDFATLLSVEGKKTALKRHNKQNIANQLITAYTKIQ